MSKYTLLAAVSATAFSLASPALAADNTEIETLKSDIQEMRQLYEAKIQSLETKLEQLESKQTVTDKKLAQTEPSAGNVSTVPASAERRIADNSFNPSIGVILQGTYKSFSETSSELAGFSIGEEGERGDEGLSLEESELNFSANVDDKFFGSATLAIVEEGGTTEVELEEAYIQTTSLPHGLQVKGGRFFAPIGYLNEHHAHSDDFADRPLTNRAFLNKAFNDDGAQLSWVAPTDLYTELGLGIFRGDDFPAGNSSGSNVGTWNPFVRFGGDIKQNTAWRVGGSALVSHGIMRAGNEDTVFFTGDSDLYAADARLTWAPTGNAKEEEVILQGEFFHRVEDGFYDDTNIFSGPVAYSDSQNGFYTQGVYKFDPAWRVGLRYSQLFAGDTPAALAGSVLDDGGHSPWAGSAMLDWTNSEFGRVRFQYNYEEPDAVTQDSQFVLQYVMSIGAHGAHPY